MTKPLEGVRILEVAQAAFVPSAALALVDWGAHVVKVEHPERGDMVRGISVDGVDPHPSGIRYLWEIFNRGKKSIGLDIGHPAGREVLLRLVDESDVFMTNFLGSARAQLHIEPDDIFARKPEIVYARGTSHGPDGPDAELGGYDPISYWSRNGMAIASMPADYDYPIPIPGPSFGDSQCGMAMAGGIAAALYHRERTGRGSIVDVSLLSAGLWAAQGTNVGASLTDHDSLPLRNRRRPPNPLATTYRTADDRFLSLGLLEADRHWPGFCAAIGRSELVSDPRFDTADARRANIEDCVEIIEAAFLERPLDEWTKALDAAGLPFGVVRTPREAQADPQARVNGFVQDLALDAGVTLPVTVAPALFDGEAPVPTRAPAHAAHTDEVLEHLGYSWDEIVELKVSGAIT
jgi:crotonobetainyl-CoA:carnitine CoA-transferase CaiB-like acyl-CoA transferase